MPYINFSEDDLYRANTANLVSYLESHGQRIKRVGSTYQFIYTDGSGTHDSVTISGGKWYDHKNQRGGYAVKFLQEFLGFSFQDSVIELLGGHCDAQTVRPSPREAPKPVPKAFELPEPNSDMRRVFAYLTKQRFISPDIISHFAHEHKIYEEKKYHNVVFVGTDENGVPKQASVRSTLSFGKTFRITVASSDTKYSFSHFGGDGKLFVFEAPIDMLSFITLYQKDWQQHSYIAMNGVYESAVLKALESHPDLQSVYLCTDNDEGGIEAAERLGDILAEKGYTNIFRLAPLQKDWNEMLKQRYGAEFLPAVPHERKELYLQSVVELSEMKIKADENVPLTKIATRLDDLIEAVIPEEERTQIKDSDRVKIVLRVKDAEETAPKEDRQVVEKTLEKLNDYKLAQYLDVSLFQIINDNESKITSTSKPITVTFEIPEALRRSGREYAVIRIHENETTVLNDLDDDPNTVTIETDKFSTYALAYTEKPQKNPATGIAISLIPLTFAVAALTAVTVKRKKK